MGFLKYKGYTGSVEYSEEDNCLFGKVQAVEDYLASCAERGVEPCKPYSGTFNVRVSPEIHSAIAAMAQQAGVTINAFVRQVLAKEVKLAY